MLQVAGHKYHLRVRARNAVGEGLFHDGGAGVAMHTPASVPTAPRVVVATASSPTCINVAATLEDVDCHGDGVASYTFECGCGEVAPLNNKGGGRPQRLGGVQFKKVCAMCVCVCVCVCVWWVGWLRVWLRVWLCVWLCVCGCTLCLRSAGTGMV